MTYQIVTPPTDEPVSIQEAGDGCRIDGSESENILAGLIAAARGLVETYTHRALMPTVIRASLDAFPGCHGYGTVDGRWWGRGDVGRWDRYHPSEIILPRPPLVSVSSVTYVDTAGTTQTLDPSAYAVDTQSEIGRITSIYGTTWPASRYQPNAVQVLYNAGYASAAAVPATLKQAMLMLVAYWYDNPNAVASPMTEQPMAVRALIGTQALPQVR